MTELLNGPTEVLKQFLHSEVLTRHRQGITFLVSLGSV